jgi:hypothetical protein
LETPILHTLWSVTDKYLSCRIMCKGRHFFQHTSSTLTFPTKAGHHHLMATTTHHLTMSIFSFCMVSSISWHFYLVTGLLNCLFTKIFDAQKSKCYLCVTNTTVPLISSAFLVFVPSTVDPCPSFYLPMFIS